MSHVENLESRLHLSAGGIDSSFGNAGQVNTPIGDSAAISSGITVLPSGKFIVAGGNANRKNDAGSLMVRYMANGSIDRSFGNAGSVPLRIGGKAVKVDALAAAPDGGILALETASGGEQVLVRYAADGSRDMRFGIGGKAALQPGFFAAQIKFDSAGNVVLGAYYSPPLPKGEIQTDGSSALALLRFSGSGKPDKSFGASGVVITQLYGSTWAPNIQPLADGKIMALAQGGSVFGGGVVRFNADGSLDTSYNQTGMSPIAPTSEMQTGAGNQEVTVITNPAQNIAAQFQPDGSVVVAYSDGENDPLSVSRITAQGALDTSFGNQGIASLPFTNRPIGISVEPDGKYLVVAETLRDVVGQDEYDNVGIARLTANGLPDSTFGNQGIAVNNNAPEIGAGSSAIDGSRVLIEPYVAAQIRLKVAAYTD